MGSGAGGGGGDEVGEESSRGNLMPLPRAHAPRISTAESGAGFAVIEIRTSEGGGPRAGSRTSCERVVLRTLRALIGRCDSADPSPPPAAILHPHHHLHQAGVYGGSIDSSSSPHSSNPPSSSSSIRCRFVHPEAQSETVAEGDAVITDITVLELSRAMRKKGVSRTHLHIYYDVGRTAWVVECRSQNGVVAAAERMKAGDVRELRGPTSLQISEGLVELQWLPSVAAAAPVAAV
eukprot:GHVU01216892.1.p1 GENE.GHVU01216892.1~~GHVU01216892.1.p1  ORF type:complete len:235 (+),score=48.76 GHVU01216892.1:34-738(+)